MNNDGVVIQPLQFGGRLGKLILLGDVEVWYGKLLCTKCHTGAKQQAESQYDTERTMI